jgi:hypothetical protein
LNILIFTLLVCSQRRVAKICQLALPCLSVYVSACKNPRTAQSIFIKSDTGMFHKNLSIYFNWTTITDSFYMKIQAFLHASRT